MILNNHFLKIGLKKNEMTIEEIIKLFGEPEDTWNNCLGKTATENSYYLYELHEMYNFWKNHVWIFNDLHEFYEFAYSITMVDYINREENEDYDMDDNTEQIALYNYILKLKNTEWTIEACENFISTFKHTSFELVQFGKVSDLINISDTEYEKCKEFYHTKEELEKVELSEGFYKIISGYIDQFDKKPKESKEDFLTFLSNW